MSQNQNFAPRFECQSPHAKSGNRCVDDSHPEHSDHNSVYILGTQSKDCGHQGA